MDENEVKQHMGFDTTRIWASQASVMLNGPLALIVFREVANVSSDDHPNDPPINVVRNVASVLLPIQTAQELGVVIRNVLGEPGEPALDWAKSLPTSGALAPADDKKK